MNRRWLMSSVALLLVVPGLSLGAMDETQKQVMQRVQEAQRKLDAAQAMQGTARSKALQDHMALMQEAMKQMHAARPGSNMTAQQMREWIDDHVKLMNQMMGQMMDGERMMMSGCR